MSGKRRAEDRSREEYRMWLEDRSRYEDNGMSMGEDGKKGEEENEEDIEEVDIVLTMPYPREW